VALSIRPVPTNLTEARAAEDIRASSRSQPIRLKIPFWYILPIVHVIAKAALLAFSAKHPDAKAPLLAWHRTMESEVFADFGDLRKTFAIADYVDGMTVFNIGGNKFRLIAAIHYRRRKVYVRAVLTHSEYDRAQWKRKG
jgi:mRNA interferase HigB